MRLDRTHVRIRERNLLELGDLSLRLLRDYRRPAAILTVIGAAPWMLLNHLAIDWMVDPEVGIHSSPMGVMFYQAMAVFIEAPLALLPLTCFLGHAVFDEAPSLRRVFGEVAGRWSQWLVSLVLIRGVLVLWGLLLWGWLLAETSDLVSPGGGIGPSGSDVLWGLLWLPLLGVVGLLRWLRPFVPEVIVLERPSWRSSGGAQPSFSERLHEIHLRSGAETAGRGLIFALSAGAATWILFGGLATLYGLLIHRWMPEGWTLTVIWPATLWCVAAWMTVLRFVNYLDVRIRQEGWEVELALRAEGERLAEVPS